MLHVTTFCPQLLLMLELQLELVDQRMNVDAVPLEEEVKHSFASHLVLSGDSNGGLHLLLVTADIGQSRQVDRYKLAQGM